MIVILPHTPISCRIVVDRTYVSLTLSAAGDLSLAVTSHWFGFPAVLGHVEMG
jgi:hypothetical protein